MYWFNGDDNIYLLDPAVGGVSAEDTWGMASGLYDEGHYRGADCDSEPGVVYSTPRYAIDDGHYALQVTTSVFDGADVFAVDSTILLAAPESSRYHSVAIVE